MGTHDPSEHAHHHDLAARAQRGERRTLSVVVLTVVMMVAEIIAGHVTGSMALVADGWHMATHAGALGLALFAYWYARTRSGSQQFTFGTGKVYALSGYSSGLLLGAVALWMGGEAVLRLFEHTTVQFGEALPVAALGLAVNLLSVVLLGGVDGGDHHGHGHPHGPGGHGHAGHDHAGHDHAGHDHAGHEHDAAAPQPGKAAERVKPTDQNLRAAYLHVISDALTSVLAIVALVAGKYAGVWWLDPAMGILGGVMIFKWSLSLCRDAAGQLLDAMPSPEVAGRIERRLEAIDDVRVADLHLWELAPGRRGCIVSLVTAEPRQVEFYRRVILAEADLAHLTVEVHRCDRGHVLRPTDSG